MKYLFLLLLANRPVLAQRGLTYWDASADSLRHVLAGQRTDTARLRTLEQLVDLGATLGHRFQAPARHYQRRPTPRRSRRPAAAAGAAAFSGDGPGRRHLEQRGRYEPLDAFASFTLDAQGKATGLKLKAISQQTDPSFDLENLDVRRADGPAAGS